MMYKLFVEVGGNLANEVDSQGNDLLGLQWWERPKQFPRADRHLLAIKYLFSARLYATYLGSARRSSLIIIS